MSGLRFGILYTENQHVATAVASLCRYHGLSGLIQHQMAQLLRDHGDLSGSYRRSGVVMCVGLGAHGCLCCGGAEVMSCSVISGTSVTCWLSV